MSPKARLARYALWMLRDYAMERAFSTALITILMVTPAVMSARQTFGTEWGRTGGRLVSVELLGSLLLVFAGAATLFAINGISSLDRKFGYFRLLFAKPLSIPRYYAILFLVHGAGVMAILGALYALWAADAGARMPSGAFLYVAIVYVLLGGIGFLFSAMTQADGLLVVAVWAGSTLLRGWYAGRNGVAGAIVTVLPPVERLGELRRALLDNTGADPSLVAWYVGYGALCFGLGLLILHRRSYTQ